MNKHSATAIPTASHKYLDLQNPQPQDICIHDICTGLASTPRWAGQQTDLIIEPLSAAIHSLYVHDYVKTYYTDSCLQFPELPLAALLNDAHKAYIGDQTTAYITALSHISKSDAATLVKNGIQKAVFQHFKLPWPLHKDLVKVIEEAENRITAAEIRDFNIPLHSDHNPVNYKITTTHRMTAHDLLLQNIVEWLPDNYASQDNENAA